jgi:TPR repeat protein
MKTLLIIVTIYYALILSGCTTMTQDCSTITGDRDAYLKCMAVQGDAKSQFDMGLAAYEALDYDAAISWFKRAAMPKNNSSIPDYATSQESDKYTPLFARDEKPMSSGHSGAQRMLIDIYQIGIGVAVNETEAAKYRAMINSQ